MTIKTLIKPVALLICGAVVIPAAAVAGLVGLVFGAPIQMPPSRRVQ